MDRVGRSPSAGSGADVDPDRQAIASVLATSSRPASTSGACAPADDMALTDDVDGHALHPHHVRALMPADDVGAVRVARIERIDVIGLQPRGFAETT